MDYIYLISIGFKEETHTKNEFQNSGNVFQATSQLQGKETSTELKRTLRLTAR